MTLTILSILIFVVTLALIISAIYFVIEAPAEKRRLRHRMDSVKTELATSESANAETRLLRAEVLSGIPFVNRVLMRTPGISRLQLFIQQSAMEITVGMLITLSLLCGWFVFLAA